MFNTVVFKERYPQFAGLSDATVLTVAEEAKCYVGRHVDKQNSVCKCGPQVWSLAVAHILTLDKMVAKGQTPGIVSSATIDKVSVTRQENPAGRSSFGYFFGQTPYGTQLLALLKRCAVGGAYIGGIPERAAFRVVGGGFPNGGRLW